MVSTRGRRLIAAVAAGVILCRAGASGAQPVLATGNQAETTRDGLHRVDPSVMETAWVKPDLDLGNYSKVLLMPTVASFREVSGRYHPRGDTEQEDFPVDERDRERFRAQFGETFHAYAAQLKPYEMTKEVGRDVLMVRGLLVDVVSGIPPDRPGSNTTFVRRPWEATVMVELRDSMSDAVLARSIERQRIDGVFDVTEIASITHLAMQDWSALLLERLKQLIDLGGGRWSRCQLRENDCAL